MQYQRNLATTYLTHTFPIHWTKTLSGQPKSSKMLRGEHPHFASESLHSGHCPERRAMPKRRYECREPTHEWRQIRPLLKDSAQIKYELIRPVICGASTSRSGRLKRESHAAPFTTRPTSLTKREWRAFCHQNHPRQSPSSINDRPHADHGPSQKPADAWALFVGRARVSASVGWAPTPCPSAR